MAVNMADETRYCTNCEDEVTVVRTVPWQQDMCQQCGHNLPDD